MDDPTVSRRDFVGLCGAAVLTPIPLLTQRETAQITESHVAGGPHDFMTVRHLRVSGTNRQIGKALMDVGRRNHGAKLAKGPRDSIRARKAYFAKHYPELYERGMGAAQSGWAKDQLDPFSLGYDGIQNSGCSTVYYPPDRTSSGHAVLSRNYDFSTGTLADIMGMPAEPGARPFTGDPYVIEMHPDKGFPSLYVTSYDLLAGCIDGVNSEGLSVALLADDYAQSPKPARGNQAGLGEIEVTRFLLDRCRDVPEAIAALKEISYYYTFIPCHYIVGDRHGRSFVWEHSIRENRPVVVRGEGPQVVTNHLLSEYSDPEKHIESFSGGSFNRYCRLEKSISDAKGRLSLGQIKRFNQSVQAVGGHSGQRVLGRTLWHSVYDLKAKKLEISFYLGESDRGPRRSAYIPFSLH